jgi:hypothetical protein
VWESPYNKFATRHDGDGYLWREVRKAAEHKGIDIEA